MHELSFCTGGTWIDNPEEREEVVRPLNRERNIDSSESVPGEEPTPPIPPNNRIQLNPQFISDSPEPQREAPSSRDRRRARNEEERKEAERIDRCMNNMSRR